MEAGEQILKLSFEDWWARNRTVNGIGFVGVPLEQIARCAWKAALAQQAQPLTDEMIEAQSRDRYSANTVSSRLDYRDGAKWARDRMAQQAQPEDGAWMQANCGGSGGTGHLFMAYVRSGDSLPFVCSDHKIR